MQIKAKFRVLVYTFLLVILKLVYYIKVAYSNYFSTSISLTFKHLFQSLGLDFLKNIQSCSYIVNHFTQ